MVSSTLDEVFIQDKLEFEDSLKDLKNLRKQLYSAAEYFESSYGEEDDNQQSVLGWSKEYVAKALVNTIDHLGCVAEKLNCFLDTKTNEFLATDTRFSSIQQRLSTFQGFVNLKGVSQHTLMIEAPKHHKQYIVPPAETLQIGISKSTCTNFIPCPQSETQKPKQENNPFAKDFQSGVINPQLFLRKNEPFIVSSIESSSRPGNFSFSRLTSHKEPGKRSGSPLTSSRKRSESVAKTRPVSPSQSNNKQQNPSLPQGASLVGYKPETTNNEREAEPKTKRSKGQLLKALLDVHWSKK